MKILLLLLILVLQICNIESRSKNSQKILSYKKKDGPHGVKYSKTIVHGAISNQKEGLEADIIKYIDSEISQYLDIYCMDKDQITCRINQGNPKTRSHLVYDYLLRVENVKKGDIIIDAYHMLFHRVKAIEVDSVGVHINRMVKGHMIVEKVHFKDVVKDIDITKDGDLQPVEDLIQLGEHSHDELHDLLNKRKKVKLALLERNPEMFTKLDPRSLSTCINSHNPISPEESLRTSYDLYEDISTGNIISDIVGGYTKDRTQEEAIEYVESIDRKKIEKQVEKIVKKEPKIQDVDQIGGMSYYFGKSSRIKVDGGIDVTPVFEVNNVGFKDFKLKFADGGIDIFNVKLSGSMIFGMEWRIFLKGKVEKEAKKWQLFNQKIGTSVFMVGLFPVVIVYSVGIEVKLQVGMEGALRKTLGGRAIFDFDLGCTYEDGEFKSHGDFNLDYLSGEDRLAKHGIKDEGLYGGFLALEPAFYLTAELYGVKELGPKFPLGLRNKLRISPRIPTVKQYMIDITVKSFLKIELKKDPIKLEILLWSKKLWSKEWHFDMPQILGGPEDSEESGSGIVSESGPDAGSESEAEATIDVDIDQHGDIDVPHQLYTFKTTSTMSTVGVVGAIANKFKHISVSDRDSIDALAIQLLLRQRGLWSHMYLSHKFDQSTIEAMREFCATETFFCVAQFDNSRIEPQQLELLALNSMVEYNSGLQQAVKAVQVLLKEKHGNKRLEIDGAFKSKTLQAVKNFQARQGIAITGVVNIETWMHLLSKAELKHYEKTKWKELLTLV